MQNTVKTRTVQAHHGEWKHSALVVCLAVSLGLVTPVQAVNLNVKHGQLAAAKLLTPKLPLHQSPKRPKQSPKVHMPEAAMPIPIAPPVVLSHSAVANTNQKVPQTAKPGSHQSYPIINLRGGASTRVTSHIPVASAAKGNSRMGATRLLTAPKIIGFHSPVSEPGGKSLLPSRFPTTASTTSRGMHHITVPIASSIQTTTPKNTSPGLFGAALRGKNSALGKAAEGGKAAQRLALIKQLQQLQQTENPGAALTPGAGGAPNCGIGNLDPTCVTGGVSNGSVPKKPSQSMLGCLQAGGSITSCSQGKGQDNPGTITAGPGSPADGMPIPGQGQASDDGENPHGHLDSDPPTGTRLPGGGTRKTTHGQYEDGATVSETVETDSSGREVYSSRTVRDSHGGVIDHRETATFNWDDGTSDTFVHENEGTDRERHWTMHNSPDSQPNPEGGSIGNDGCDWNPSNHACNKKKADPLGMTSQPGQNPGGKPGRTGIAPNVGIAGAINCGDVSSEACSRGGSGLSSGGQRLDMKGDKGPGISPGGTPQ